ncbi:unnamed protein product [Somion occarium]|uniref:F-box domain-containing protein n=1 Tax=Somion occarium TaxID=3059160 RepID=A0ABP1CG21_9APHY
MTSLINERLPEELLADILLRWSFIDEDGAWMASAVCKHWRRVILSCPQAWAKVSLTFKPEVAKVPEEWCIEEDDLDRAASPREKQRPLARWLQRSAGVPLFLRIHVEVLAPGLYDKMANLLPHIMSHLDRVVELEINSDSSIFTSSILVLFSSHLFRLRRISLHFVRSRRLVILLPEGEDFGLPDFWTLFSACRELHAITVRGCGLPVPANPTPIPQQLTYLDIQQVAPDHQGIMCLPLLCKNLTVLHIHSISPFCSDTPPNMRISLPNLTTLSLLNMGTSDLAYLLRDIDAPRLSRLSLSGFGESEWRVEIEEGAKTYELFAGMGEAFEAFIMRCPEIRELHISDTLFPDRHLLAVLQHLNNLRELHLQRTFVGAPALRALTRVHPAEEVAGKKILCPQLWRLKFVHCDFVSAEYLARLVQSRNSISSATSPIRKLTLNYCRSILEKDAQTIRNASSSAMNIRFKAAAIVNVEEDAHEVEIEEGNQGLPLPPRVTFANFIEQFIE